MKEYPRTLKHGSGVTMTLDPTRLLLSFDEPQSHDTIGARLRDVGLELEDAGDARIERTDRPGVQAEVVNHTATRFWVRTPDREPLTDERVKRIEGAFAGAPATLEWIGPVYRLPNIEGRGGLLCPLPNALLLRFGREAGGEEGRAAKLQRLGLDEVPAKSRYLGPYSYYMIRERGKHTAYEIQARLTERERTLVEDVRFENMPMLVPLAIVPTDNLFAQQWDMSQIMAPQGWDISTGTNTVLVSVLDSGCDLTHPDLQPQFATTTGINLGTMMPDGSPRGSATVVAPHGTCCAGIVAASFNNALGVAGLAGGCQLMPLAFEAWTDVEVAAGIGYAAANGAQVISMSFGQYAPTDGIGPSGWDFTIIDPAIADAVNVHGLVLCAATGNENIGTFNRYPARHPLVMACGASDQVDNRKSTTSPDGENWWGSNFAPGVSVVAPGVLIPTTDRQGTDGYNPTAGAAGDYFLTFNGTSSATPHVAGLAGLLRSQYATLTNFQVRDVIERTADKVGTVPYAEDPAFPNGVRNQELGYGRINVFRALDSADLMIRDWPSDAGTEPSAPPGGDFWDFSDIVVRITDDNVFVPSDPSKSSNVERGQTNYLYVQITNNGPREARNVVVSARITPYVGLQFLYPDDWTFLDATHVSPTPVTATFATVPSGSAVMAKFTISSTQVEELWGWISGSGWHPCLLAQVTADNDYAFASANLTGPVLSQRRNNLAQRNLSVIDVLAGASATFPLVAGHLRNADTRIELRIDRSELPREMPLLLALDEDGQLFPRVDFFKQPARDEGEAHVTFLDQCRIDTVVGGCHGVLTLAKGSRFTIEDDHHRHAQVTVQGGEVVLRDGKRFVEVREPTATVRIPRRPNSVMPLALRTLIPSRAAKGDRFTVKVSQYDERGVRVGGAGAVYIVR